MARAASKGEMPRAYDPGSVEGPIYRFWNESGFFRPEIDHSKKPFVIIMPPPNVTGELHVGHALTIARRRPDGADGIRMLGEPYAVPARFTDHAGIATQVVVERLLASDGLTRHDLGRDRFIERVWSWVDDYGDRIYQPDGATRSVMRLEPQARSLWTQAPRSQCSTTFVNLYNKGLIYKGTRITNWCPRCRTALSDLEVKHQQENSGLYHIRYPLEDGSGHLVIATTRPETMLGDTAVAVNPDDDRYAGYR